MNELTTKILPSTCRVTILVLGLSLAACGKDDSSSVAKVDACPLVTASMVANYAASLGNGHPGAIL